MKQYENKKLNPAPIQSPPPPTPLVSERLNKSSFSVKINHILSYKMKKYIEEEIISINHKLFEYIIYSNLTKRKESLIQLLQRLNQLRDVILKEAREQLSQSKNVDINQAELCGTMYAFGQISTLKRMIRLLVNAIKEGQEENKFTEKDEKIIEESKDKDEMNYFG